MAIVQSIGGTPTTLTTSSPQWPTKRTSFLRAATLKKSIPKQKKQLPKIESIIRVRVASHDAHYAGNLVDGAKVLQYFGDVATEILIRLDGDEGLFRAYKSVEFLAPVTAGDYLEVIGRLVEVGNSSRTIAFHAYKVISNLLPGQQGYKAPSSARVLPKKVEVCRAVGVCVTPLELQSK